MDAVLALIEPDLYSMLALLTARLVVVYRAGRLYEHLSVFQLTEISSRLIWASRLLVVSVVGVVLVH